MTLDISPEILALISLFNGSLCAYIASRRGRHVIGWFLIGLFFGLIGLVVLALMPKKTPSNVAAVALNSTASLPSAESTIAIESAKEDVTESASWYYIDNEKKTIGPLSLAKLKEHLTTGILKQESYVWNESMSDWKKVQDIDSLKSKA